MSFYSTLSKQFLLLSRFQTEKHIQEYNKMARKLKLIPSTAEHANGIDFEMHFNPHTQRPDQRTHVDFKGTIKVLPVLTENESCLLIRFPFFLLLLLGSRNARILAFFIAQTVLTFCLSRAIVCMSLLTI